MNVSLGIKVGDIFHSIEETEKKIAELAKQNYVQFYKRESRTIAAGSRKTKRYLNPELKFYQVEWACVHGGRKFKCRSNGIRRSKTLKHQEPCPAQIRIKVAPNGNEFVVINVEDKHNHKIFKSLFDELPQQRKLPSEVREDTKKLLDMKVNRHMLRDELERKLDKKITLKDLSNLQTENKAQYNNNIKEACEKIQSKFGTDSHILLDGNNVFKGMMFCSGAMKSAMAAYPEFLCMDGTYKLLNIRTPVYLILNENGNGESIVVAVGILVSEDKESLIWFLENFKKENPNWTRTKTIMTDKDLIERNVITECFPEARLQICIFHALKIFQTEITCDKFKITASEKHTILEFLQKLVYSKNESEFFTIVETMRSCISERVFQYLETNWINIKDEWYLGAQHNNFLNTTNNRIESINAKLKQVISKHSTIGEFLDKLVTILKSLEKEQNTRLANLLNKRPTTLHKCDTIEYKYQSILTPYAFMTMKKQFLYKSVKVVVNDETIQCYDSSKLSTAYCTTHDSCTCYFHLSMCLPCKHIFAVRHYLNVDLYVEDIIPERWKMTYLLENNTLLSNTEIDCSGHDVPTNNLVEVLTEKPKRILSAQEKYRLLFTKCKMAASLGVEAQGENFNKVTNLFDDIVKMLQHNIYNFNFTYTTDNCENESITEKITSEHLDTECDDRYSIDEQDINMIPEMDCQNEYNTQIIGLDSTAIQDTNVNIEIQDSSTHNGGANENFYHDGTTVPETTHEYVFTSTNLDSDVYSYASKEVETVCTSENDKTDCGTNKNLTIDNEIYFHVRQDYSYSSNVIGSEIKQNQIYEEANIKPDENVNIENIIVIPSKVKGRPKGRDLTVIGLPKKIKKERKSFENKSANEKRNIILNWLLTSNTRIENKKNITLTDLKSVDDIDIRICEVNVSVIKKILPTQLWDTVKCLKQKKRLLACWTCPICSQKILANEPTVRCDACLHWFHVSCSNYIATTSSSSTWYCNTCN